MEIIVLAVPFITAALMFVVKQLAGLAAIGNPQGEKTWLRTVLVIFSFFGMVASSVITGTPISEDSVSQLLLVLIGTPVSAYLSHAFYNSAFKRSE